MKLQANILAVACLGTLTGCGAAGVLPGWPAPAMPHVAVFPELPANEGSTIEVSTRMVETFKTQTQSHVTPAQITYYEIQLIPSVNTIAVAATTGDNYTSPAVTYGVFFDGDAGGQPANTLIDATADGRMKFTGILPGAYRVRVRATDIGGPAATITNPNTVNKPDGYFTNSAGWAISSNFVYCVANGPPQYKENNGTTNSANPWLNVTVNLRDASNDAIPMYIVPTDGNNSAPPIDAVPW